MPIPPSKHYFEDFVELTGSAHSREHLFEIFTRVMLFHGFDRVNFSIKHDDDVAEIDQGFGLISTYPAEWQSYYHDRDFGKIDPVLRCAASTFRPFRWRELERRMDLSDRQVKFLGQAEEAGLRNGVGIPFSGPKMQIAGVALATSSSGNGQLKNLDLLAAFCNQFYLSFKRLTGRKRILTPALATLSLREAEILLWIARGRTDDQISLLLDISVNTVDFHVRNVFRKLDVNSRVAAVAIAMSYGLIEL
jgi:DNA-binding CsgD family transcriptional regulator